YVCCEPIAGIKLEDNRLIKSYPDNTQEEYEEGTFNSVDEISNLRQSFESNADARDKFITDGHSGYIDHEAREHIEDIKLKEDKQDERKIPTLQYYVYRYIIAIDHFKNELYIVKKESEFDEETNNIDKIEYLIQNKNFPEYSFTSKGE